RAAEWPLFFLRPDHLRETDYRSSAATPSCTDDLGNCSGSEVRHFNKAVLVGDYVFQIPSLLCGRVTKQAQAVTQQNRSYGQLNFVHQAEFEKTLRQHGSAYEPDISIAKPKFFIQECLEVARIKLDAVPCRGQLPARHHYRRGIAIGPAQLQRMFICAGTEHITVDRFDERRCFFLRN